MKVSALPILITLGAAAALWAPSAPAAPPSIPSSPPLQEKGGAEPSDMPLAAPDLTVLSQRLVDAAGKRLLELEIQNGGKEAHIPTLLLELYQGGETVGHFRTVLKGIAPGSSLCHHVDISEIPPGSYRSLTTVTERGDVVSGLARQLEIR